MKLVHILPLLASLASPLSAESPSFTVQETAGLRRFGYPVTASLELAGGQLLEVGNARLTNASGKEVPAQLTAITRWPDGSVRGLDVDFAPSLGPLETEMFAVELGESPKTTVKGGLAVTETPDDIIVASSAISHRVKRGGKPLLASISFGDNEFIGSDGIRTTIPPGPAVIVKRGPFNVTLRMGEVTLEYVSTKSWVKITQRSESKRELGVDAHFRIEKLPLLWDFGVGHWLYGTLPRTGQTVSIRHDEQWRIVTDKSSLFGVAKVFDGCGHLADAERVSAFGVLDCGDDVTVSLESAGRIQIRSQRDSFTTFFHVVGQPIPVTAVTSPQAMVSPLKVHLRSRTAE